MYLYDLTRLIARSSADTATGIDRVDLEYAKEFQKHKTIYVIQKEGCFDALSSMKATRFLRDINNRWQGNNQLNASYLKSLLLNQEKINGYPKERWAGLLHRINLFLMNSKSVRRKLVNERLDNFLTIHKNGIVKYISKSILSNILIYIPGILKVPLKILAWFEYINNRSTVESKSGACVNDLTNVLTVESSEPIYINASHHGIGDEARFSWLSSIINTRYIFLIHDLIPLTHPEYVRTGDKENFIKRLDVVTKYADLVVFTSNVTKQVFIEETKRLNFYNNKIKYVVLHNGVDNTFLHNAYADNTESLLVKEVLRKSKSNYYITVGTLEPRKNLLMLIDIWRNVTRQNACNVYLVIIGRSGWCNENIMATIERGRYMEKVIVLQSVKDTDLIKLMKKSKALLFPSFAEGWGLPLVEAIALKVPAICSDIDVLRESGQNLVEYVDPYDPVRWLKVIKEYSIDKDGVRSTQIKNIEKYKMPTWDNYFVNFLNAAKHI